MSQDNEVWAPVVNREGSYEVSSLGRIKSLTRNIIVKSNNNSYIKRVPERIRILGLNPQGYRTIHYGKGATRLVHREVATSFIPNTNMLPFVNHINGVKTDNRVENLEWCTREYNERHAILSGLKSSLGSNNTMAKLDELSVLLIRKLSTEKSAYELGKMFNVHPYTIRRVINRETWDHVLNPD